MASLLSSMYSRPRTQIFASLLFALSLGALLMPVDSFAQGRGQSGKPRPASPARPLGEAAAKRAQAINLLVDTADRARIFTDLAYRARIQMLAADALWSFDEVRARQIFRRAWEAASAADRAEQRAAEEEAGVFTNSEETTITDARDEVLSKAASRDPKLAETFLRELVGERERAQSNDRNDRARRTPWRELSPQGARRLALAYVLLNKREYNRAAQVAAPLISEGASGDIMEFLLRLRFASPQGKTVADALYLRLVERAQASANLDANDVLLLSSYIVSPDLLTVVDEKGGLQFRTLAFKPDAAVNRREGPASKAFYNLAVSVLLSSSFSRRETNVVQDRIARYVATGRLLPFFEQAGPEHAQFVPGLRSQLASLAGEIEASRRDALGAQVKLTGMASNNATDPLAPQLEQLARARDKEERDRISLAIVRKAAQARLWDRAQRAAYSIENADLRRAVLSFIAVSQIADLMRAYKDDKEEDFESVARFVRRSEVPPFASAWGLAQAATIAARKKDKAEVEALLSEAESYAARVDRASRQRIAAYIVITETAARLQSPRAWDFLSELVRAVNAAVDYKGDEVSLGTSTDTAASEFTEQLSIESDAFRLDGIFATMARLDFDKTLSQAQALAGEIPRSYARIAAARAALERK